MNAKKAEKKQIQRNQERTVDESLFKPKEAERKQKNWKKESTKLIWKQMGQERTKEESLFKVKETEQKQEQTEKRKYMMKLN